MLHMKKKDGWGVGSDGGRAGREAGGGVAGEAFESEVLWNEDGLAAFRQRRIFFRKLKKNKKNKIDRIKSRNEAEIILILGFKKKF